MLTSATKDWKAGRRWARRNALATPGVTYTICKDGRHISYRYEAGLMYCTGTGKHPLPYRPWTWAEWYRKRKEEFPNTNPGQTPDDADANYGGIVHIGARQSVPTKGSSDDADDTDARIPGLSKEQS